MHQLVLKNFDSGRTHGTNVKTLYQFYGRLDGHQGRCKWAWKISPRRDSNKESSSSQPELSRRKQINNKCKVGGKKFHYGESGEEGQGEKKRRTSQWLSVDPSMYNRNCNKYSQVKRPATKHSGNIQETVSKYISEL